MRKTIVAFAVLYVLTLLAFAWLYFFTPPREVVREIIRDATPAPVERIVQPVEKMVQDTLRPLLPPQPAGAAPAQKDIDWESIPATSSEAEALKDLGPVRVSVTVSELLSKVFSASAAQDAVLASLKNHNIPVSPDAKSTLNINLQGLWDDSQQVLTYRVSVSLAQSAILVRPGGPVRSTVDIWQRGSYGFTGRLSARDTVINEAVRLGDLFCDIYLDANPPPPAPPTLQAP